ncbi:DUF2569 domain-containing protein [Bosea sp. (in: a-proteobacteria)]|uniref:DUF2569 domain-containing protein n=1 Tax=Bosea sp. (in: a-proteobacteria) TaxID=1871050 RepID=UPI001AD556F4|nr:DUF2569 domain-containing protein [Bosea sp. (in: a-proteobacteria)]MBN9438831.1 DUF2569 domain-containing protein [Bosea sp. (in: a-proteobacteria)]
MSAIQVSKGFHRFGIFLSALTFVVCIVAGAREFDPSSWWAAGAILALAAYGLSRLLGWSVNGFRSPAIAQAGRGNIAERPTAQPHREAEGQPRHAALSSAVPTVSPPSRDSRWSPLPDGSPPNLGGWLLLPALSTFLAPLFVLAGLFTLYPVVQVFGRLNGTMQAYVAISVAINVGLAVAWIYACILLAKRRRAFPGLFMGLLIMSAVLVSGDIVAASSLLNIQPDSSSYRDLGRALSGVVIWVPYMLMSKRVAATFIG